jgi:hypothetical protein
MISIPLDGTILTTVISIFGVDGHQAFKGTIGALVGATLGFVEFKAVSHLMLGKMHLMDKSQPNTPERQQFELKMLFLKRIMFIGTVVTTAMIGYAVGRLVK